MSGFALDVFQGRERLCRKEIPTGGLSIGRAQTNDLVLADRTVSSRHARVELSGSQLTLFDLGSASGTFRAGEVISEIPIHLDEDFQIGPYVLRVVTTQGGVTARSHLPAPELPGDPLSTTEFTNLVQGWGDLTSLVRITDLQAVLESLLERTMQLLDCQTGYVFLTLRGRLSPILAKAGTAWETLGVEICQQVLEKTAPVIVTDTAELRRLSGSTPPPAMALGIPLIDDSDVLGILFVASRRPSERSNRTRALSDVAQIGGRALRVALERRQLLVERERFRWLAVTASEEPDLFRSSRSTAMQQSLGIVRRTAPEDVTVLIRGESGTGKDVTARTIHRLSPRKDGPFIAINCGAIPRELMESELFGYEKGAFTGATARKLGQLELAQGGTLFLDEIGDLPKDLQVKLLRVLETRTFQRVGGAEAIPWDARLMAATNLNLEDAVTKGDFRQDLYYRLNVVTVWLPPLRDRREDFEPLVNEILLGANRKFRRKIYGVAPEAVELLSAYAWPGNVRELRNVIERAFILETTDRITPASLLFPSAPREERQADLPMRPLAEFLLEQERSYLRLALDRTGGSITEAARILGVTRTSLHRRLRVLGLRESSEEE